MSKIGNMTDLQIVDTEVYEQATKTLLRVTGFTYRKCGAIDVLRRRMYVVVWTYYEGSERVTAKTEQRVQRILRISLDVEEDIQHEMMQIGVLAAFPPGILPLMAAYACYPYGTPIGASFKVSTIPNAMEIDPRSGCVFWSSSGTLWVHDPEKGCHEPLDSVQKETCIRKAYPTNLPINGKQQRKRACIGDAMHMAWDGQGGLFFIVGGSPHLWRWNCSKMARDGKPYVHIAFANVLEGSGTGGLVALQSQRLLCWRHHVKSIIETDPTEYVTVWRTSDLVKHNPCAILNVPTLPSVSGAHRADGPTCLIIPSTLGEEAVLVDFRTKEIVGHYLLTPSIWGLARIELAFYDPHTANILLLCDATDLLVVKFRGGRKPTPIIF